MRSFVLAVTMAIAVAPPPARAGCPLVSQPQPVTVQVVAGTPRFVSAGPWALTFSPDGRYLASWGRYLGLQLWDARTRRPIWTVPAPAGFLSWTTDAIVATYEPAGVTTHVSLADHRVTTEKLLRYPITGGGALVIDGEAIELRDEKDHRVRALAWPGKTHRLARVAVGDDGTVAGFVATLDADSHQLEPGKLLDWWDPTGKPHEIALAEVGNKLWVRGKQIFIIANGMQTLDTATAILTAHPEVPSSQQYAISPSGDRVAFTSGVVVLGQRQPSWQSLQSGLWYNSVASVAFDPTGRALAFGGNDPIALVDAATGHIVARFGQALNLLMPEFLDDKTLVTHHADYISTWDLTTGALDPARTRAVLAEHAAVVGGDLFVARTSERRPYDCRAIYLDRWTKGVPPADLDEAVDAEAPSDTHVTDQPPAIPRGAARVPFCPSQYFRYIDFAHLRGLQSTSGKPYRWTDLDGKHETVLAGSDMLDTSEFGVARDGTLAGLVGDKLLMWAPSGAQSKLALPPLPDDMPIQQRSAPFALDATRVAVGHGLYLVLAARAALASPKVVKLDALPEGVGFAGPSVLVRFDDGTLRRYSMDGSEQARATLPHPDRGFLGPASPDGKRVIVANGDWTIELWDAVALRPIATLVASDDGEWATLTPDGAFTGSSDAASMLAVVFAGASPSAPAMEPYEHTFRRPDLVKAWFAGKSSPPLAAVPAPQVALAQPAQVDGNLAHVSARVTSATGSGELVAFVDGHERARAKYCGATVMPQLDVPGARGAERLTLVAFDDQGGSAEVAETLAGSAARKPELWAVVVGIGAYKKLPPQWSLHADRDARALAHLFDAMKGTGFADVHVTTLIDDKATRASVDKALADLRKMQPGDLAVVYLAGHGWRTAKGGTNLLTTAVGTRQEAEALGITWTAIRDRLEAAPGRVLVLLDACHAGAFSQDVVVPNEQLAAALARRGRSGVVVFAATRGRQFSYEVGAARGHFALVADEAARVRVAAKKQDPKAPPAPPAPPAAPAGDLDTPVGLFTTAVIAAFAQPDADLDHNGTIELSELVEHVTAAVMKDSKARQTPIVSRRELFGDFVVGPRL